ncbi:MAG: ABC transporter permease [Clostridiales bacterium]|jgi:ribose/xylose/arabinose/galactoside ABC-type transport system permease subunit|nr:ABC transporter permease [Clostridiales bacterium]
MRIAKPFRFSYTYALIALNLALIVGFGLSSPSFFSLSTLRGTIMLTAEIGIMALPLTLLIIMGCTDFSMCAILTLSASLGGMACRATGSELLGVLVMLAIGALCGLFNGAMVAKLRLPPLISTLATQYLFRGITEGIVLGTGYGINVATTGAASFMGSGNILGVMTQLWLFAMLAVAFGAVLRRTVYGRLLYAIGMNESASRFAGINTVRIKLLTYVIGGIVFSLAGMVLLGRFSAIQYNSADSYLLQIIIACVLGGINMNGGHGSIGGTCLGVAVIGILKSGMNFVQLPQTQQKIFLGIILLVSLIASEVIARGEKRLKPRRS